MNFDSSRAAQTEGEAMVRELQAGEHQVDRQLDEGTIQLFKDGEHLAGKGAHYDVAWDDVGDEDDQDDDVYAGCSLPLLHVVATLCHHVCDSSTFQVYDPFSNNLVGRLTTHTFLYTTLQNATLCLSCPKLYFLIVLLSNRMSAFRIPVHQGPYFFSLEHDAIIMGQRLLYGRVLRGGVCVYWVSCCLVALKFSTW
jgi:hypothetical protein